MGIIEKAREIAETLKKKKSMLIVAHADADGVAGASIAIRFFMEGGIDYDVVFIKQMEEWEEYRGHDVLFVDVGNGSVKEMEETGIKAIVVDHHIGEHYSANSLNPYFYGIDGGEEISASGLMYLISNTTENANLAIIGAIGDMQKMIGWNEKILRRSSIEVKRDIRTYGRNMPLYKMLSFSPLIPPLFGRVGRTIKFLENIGIDGKMKWNELEREEKKKILSGIVEMMVRRGYEKEDIYSIYGDVYEINGRDVREIVAMVNSMAKYGKYRDAINACITGNFEYGEKFIEEHRKNIRNGIKIARKNLADYGMIKYFHAGRKIRDTILGTIAGMIMESERISKPLIGFAQTDGKVKVSARIPRNMNINIGRAVRNAARQAGGSGGGHRMAAGATIPAGMEEEFLKFFEKEIKPCIPSGVSL